MHFHWARRQDAEYQSSEFIEQKKDKPAAFVTERWKSDMQGAWTDTTGRVAAFACRWV